MPNNSVVSDKGIIHINIGDKILDPPAIETLSAGTLFYRLRIPKNEESGYTDGILEDNRVFRVIEEYKFSEPVSYQVMKDMDGKKFSYSFVK